jgi:protein-ribulosamine 3-kinase
LPIPASPRAELQAELRAELGIERADPASGGCIHDCYRVTIDGNFRFLKTNDSGHADAFVAEAEGLSTLRSARARAPEPLAHGVAAGRAYLLLEYLTLDGPDDFAQLGRMLATVHRTAAPRFGWHRDNYIGATPQQNGWRDDWREFWIERRMRPQLELAKRNGFRIAEPSLRSLDGHRPQPSLLHGDLWSGNAGFAVDGPAVFDPAVYYGDREAELAMTELFGGFPRAFYEAYQAAWPLEAGYEKRKHLYNLYHLLNHLNLFGRSYLAQVEATLGLLRSLP